MKNLLSTCILGLSLFVQTSIAQYGNKGSFIDFSSNEHYNDGLISDIYKPNNLGVHMSCGTISDDLGNGNIFNRGIFTGIDANGFLLSSKEYQFFSAAGTFQSQLNSICENSNVRFTCSGNVKLSTSHADVLLLQTDQLGNAIKARKIDFGGGLDDATCTRKSRNLTNAYYTCGKTKSMVSGATNFFVVRHNGDGSVLNWSKSIAPSVPGWLVESEATSVIDESNTGHVIVIGNYKNANGNESTKRAFIAKLTNAGVVKWIHTFVPASFSELDLQSIRPTENPQSFVLTGSAKQNSNGRISTVVLRVKTSSDLKPSIEFFNYIISPGTQANPTIKQEGNDIVYQNINGVIKYYVAATSYMANGNKLAMQIECANDGKAIQAKSFMDATNSTFSAIDLVQNQLTGNGIACFGSQQALLDVIAGIHQKGMLVKSTLALETACGEVNETPFNATIVSSSSSLSYAIANLGVAQDIGVQSINGQIYAACWDAFQPNGARFDELNHEESITEFLPEPTIYPNPVAGATSTLKVYSDGYEDVQLTIVDMHGRTTWMQTIAVQLGENQIEINLSEMDAGIYTIVLQRKTQANRFIKLVKQ